MISRRGRGRGERDETGGVDVAEICTDHPDLVDEVKEALDVASKLPGMQTAGVGGDPIADLVDKVRTEVDPAFVYEYEQTKFVPPAGKTLLIVGQTLEEITEMKDLMENVFASIASGVITTDIQDRQMTRCSYGSGNLRDQNGQISRVVLIRR